MHPFQGKPYNNITIDKRKSDGETHWTYERTDQGVKVETGSHIKLAAHNSYTSTKALNVWDYLLKEITEEKMILNGGFMLNGSPVKTEAEARAVVADLLELDKEDGE